MDNMREDMDELILNATFLSTKFCNDGYLKNMTQKIPFGYGLSEKDFLDHPCYSLEPDFLTKKDPATVIKDHGIQFYL
jgi:hypothetical protein